MPIITILRLKQAKESFKTVKKQPSPIKAKHTGGRSKKFDIETFKQATELYLLDCTKNNRIPFLVDLAMYIGVHKDTIQEYKKFKDYAVCIKKVELATESALFHAGITGTKPIMSIFLLKALFGYKEGSNLDITTNGQPLGVVQLPSRGK